MGIALCIGSEYITTSHFGPQLDCRMRGEGGVPEVCSGDSWPRYSSDVGAEGQDLYELSRKAIQSSRLVETKTGPVLRLWLAWLLAEGFRVVSSMIQLLQSLPVQQRV